MKTVSEASVLIVDDEPDNLSVLNEYLSESGFRVLVARSGETAIRVMSHFKPDIILLDILMKGMDGFETCRHIKNNKETEHIPVLFMTAVTDTDFKIRGFESGAVDYITKPFQIQEVLVRMETHLSLQRMKKEVEKKNADLQEEIAERKRAETALWESREHLAATLRSIGDGVISTDNAGRVKNMNRVAEKLCGWKADEAKGRPVSEVFCIINSKTRQSAENPVKKILAEGNIMGLDRHTALISQDGCERQIADSGAPILDADGNIIGSVLVFRDVSEEYRMQETLRENEKQLAKSNALFKAVIRQAPFGAHILEGGFDNIRVVIENKESERILGESVEGKKDIDGNHPEALLARFYSPDGKREIPLSEMAGPRAFKGEIVRHEEYLFRHPDGREIHVEADASPVYDDNKEIMAIVVTFHDISSRKKAEEQIKASLREKEVMLREIHHRVKNNLMVVSSLIQMQAELTKEPQSLSLFSDLHHRVMAMCMVHEDLYQSDNLAEINFASYLERLADSIRQGFSRTPVCLRISAENIFLDVEKAIPCGLIAAELLSNAFKHAFPLSLAKDIHSPEIHLEMRKTDNFHTLCIRDNGVGMPKGMDWQNSEGLGLELVRSWAEHQLKGTMNVESRRGTEFFLTFQ